VATTIDWLYSKKRAGTACILLLYLNLIGDFAASFCQIYIPHKNHFSIIQISFIPVTDQILG
jgi:hypothetical protein